MQEDLRDRSFQFATRIVKLCQTLDATPGVSRTLANQLLRSGTSIGANIEEANGGQSKAGPSPPYAPPIRIRFLCLCRH